MGILMHIRALRLAIGTASGPHGFEFEFSRNLTIVRGGNSSGKSTFFSALLYSIGMEELIGGRNEKALPYAVKDYFNSRDDEVSVEWSETWVELENRRGEIITLQRSIVDKQKDPRLVQVYRGAHLLSDKLLPEPMSTYLHDPGSAQYQQGFFRFFEEYLELELPRVAANTGLDTKLYLQAMFAAHAVEQKRGWTDYIANIPYYGIREARTRVTEFVLGLGVFETISKRNQLNSESSAIANEWTTVNADLRKEALAAGLGTTGIPKSPAVGFVPENASLTKSRDGEQVSIADYLAGLRRDLATLQAAGEVTGKEADEALMAQLTATEERIAKLAELYERASTSLALERLSLGELQRLLDEAETSLRDNRTTLKLREMGAELGVKVAAGVCPTCDQDIEDSLLPSALAGPQMDLEANVGHLSAQRRMLTRQIAGQIDNIRQAEATQSDLAQQLAAQRDFAVTTRHDLGTTAVQSKAQMRRLINIELEIDRVEHHTGTVMIEVEKLTALSKRVEANQLARRALPKEQYTEADQARISYFEKLFRAYAGSFGYESVAKISDIQISPDNLLPVLSRIELREINTPRSDIRNNSSASDFVRLIWSYLMALYEAAARPDAPGNHIGILLLDEPGQHSMRDVSQHELLLRLSHLTQLQSIVAASFDESDAVFNAATHNVTHKLIEWEGKLIRPLQ
jgi:hypothetical protein